MRGEHIFDSGETEGHCGSSPQLSHHTESSHTVSVSAVNRIHGRVKYKYRIGAGISAREFDGKVTVVALATWPRTAPGQAWTQPVHGSLWTYGTVGHAWGEAERHGLRGGRDHGGGTAGVARGASATNKGRWKPGRVRRMTRTMLTTRSLRMSLPTLLKTLVRFTKAKMHWNEGKVLQTFCYLPNLNQNIFKVGQNFNEGLKIT